MAGASSTDPTPMATRMAVTSAPLSPTTKPTKNSTTATPKSAYPMRWANRAPRAIWRRRTSTGSAAVRRWSSRAGVTGAWCTVRPRRGQTDGRPGARPPGWSAPGPALDADVEQHVDRDAVGHRAHDGDLLLGRQRAVGEQVLPGRAHLRDRVGPELVDHRLGGALRLLVGDLVGLGGEARGKEIDDGVLAGALVDVAEAEVVARPRVVGARVVGGGVVGARVVGGGVVGVRRLVGGGVVAVVVTRVGDQECDAGDEGDRDRGETDQQAGGGAGLGRLTGPVLPAAVGVVRRAAPGERPARGTGLAGAGRRPVLLGRVGRGAGGRGALDWIDRRRPAIGHVVRPGAAVEVAVLVATSRVGMPPGRG